MKFVRLGAVLGSFGLDGWVKVSPMTENPDLLENAEYLLLGKDGQAVKSLKIEDFKYQGGNMLFKCENVNTIAAAEALGGLSVLFPEEQLPKTDDDEVYWYLIDGARVLDTDGVFIGTLVDYLECSSGDIFRIKLEDGTFALISNNKAHVLNIDKNKKELTIVREGLIDEKL